MSYLRDLFDEQEREAQNLMDDQCDEGEVDPIAFLESLQELPEYHRIKLALENIQ